MRKTIISVLVLSAALAAQTNPNVQSFSFNANILNGPNAGVGTDVGATFGVTQNFLLRQDNLIFPNVAAQFFGGGLEYNLPTCTILLNTNLNCKNFQFYVSGSLGDSHVPSGAPHTNYFSGMAGGGINYDPTGSGKFSINLLDFHEARLPGMSTGWTAIAAVGVKLGWGTNQAATQAKIRAVQRQNAKRLKKAQEKAAKEAKQKV